MTMYPHQLTAAGMLLLITFAIASNWWGESPGSPAASPCGRRSQGGFVGSQLRPKLSATAPRMSVCARCVSMGDERANTHPQAIAQVFGHRILALPGGPSGALLFWRMTVHLAQGQTGRTPAARGRKRAHYQRSACTQCHCKESEPSGGDSPHARTKTRILAPQ